MKGVAQEDGQQKAHPHSIYRFASHAHQNPIAMVTNSSVQVLADHEEAKGLLNSLNSEGNTPLFVAIKNGNPLCTTKLLALGAELNIRCKGRSPLHEAMQLTGNKAKGVVSALVDASPELLSDVDPVTGNTALHAATNKQSLSSLLFLVAGKLEINATNKAGQTALHLHAYRGDLGCVMTLAAFNIGLDVRDSNGNTALHIAVSKGSVELTKALLLVGADPNATNSHGDSVRHLAASINSKEKTELIHCLEVCYASRCPAKKIGCHSGCAVRRSPPLKHSASSGSPLESTKRSSQSASPVDVLKFNSLQETSRAKRANTSPVPTNRTDADSEERHAELEECSLAGLSKYNNERCIERVLELLEPQQSRRRLINLLSLDGGGIKGLLLIQVMLVLEKELDDSLFDYFDWAAGTSTGSIVCAGLATGKSLRDCQRIYLRFKDKVFEGYRPYNAAVLEKFIQQEVGSETTMADVEWPRITITTVKADTFPVSLELFRNYQLPHLTQEENTKMGYSDPNCQKLWRALRCSSAAPTYFTSVDGKYVDGGLVSNNPCVDLIHEVHRHNSLVRMAERRRNRRLQPCLGKDREEVGVEMGCVLSIGTGRIPDTAMEALDVDYSGAGIINSAVAMKNLGLILVDQASLTEGPPVERAEAWCHSLAVPFFRFSTQMSLDVALDTKDDQQLVVVMWDVVETMHNNKEPVRRFCRFLKRLGKSQSRRDYFDVL